VRKTFFSPSPFKTRGSVSLGEPRRPWQEPRTFFLARRVRPRPPPRAQVSSPLPSPQFERQQAQDARRRRGSALFSSPPPCLVEKERATRGHLSFPCPRRPTLEETVRPCRGIHSWIWLAFFFRRSVRGRGGTDGGPKSALLSLPPLRTKNEEGKERIRKLR